MISWGMNVDVADFDKFAAICNVAGIKHLRLNCDGECSIEPFLEKIRDYGMKAYVVPFSFKSDCDRGSIENLPLSYHKLSATIPVDICAGIALPENSHLLTLPRSKVGLKRVALTGLLNDMVAAIKSNGHVAVFPTMACDLKDGLKVDADVFDISVFVDRDYDFGREILFLKDTSKRVWLGRAGQYGGTLLAAQQRNMIDRFGVFAKATKIESVYLWSDKKYSGFHWSKDGAFGANFKWS
jgi:hypothetical protein